MSQPLPAGLTPDELAARIAELEARLESGVAPADATEFTRLKAELDALLSELKRPASPDTYEAESACSQVTSKVKQIGRDTRPATSAGSKTGRELRTSGGKAAASEQASGADKPDAKKQVCLGPYELLSKLGEGGMGTVYKARHVKLDKFVAIKVLPRDRLQDKAAVARFEREMRAVGRVDHENIVRAMDAGEVNGRHYLVMEYVSGIDLARLLKKLGPLPIAAACELIRQAAVGLDEAHAYGMVHRDIKPSNLMLCRSPGRRPPIVKILDLGLALLSDAHAPETGLTSTGQVMGTLDYMAPEQGGDSKSVDIRADLYSLGATLYRLLTGEVIYHGQKYETPVQKMMALALEPAPPIQSRRADIPDGLAAIIHRLLAKNPADRYATPDEVAEALAPYCAGADLVGLLTGAGFQPPAGDEIKSDTRPHVSAASVNTADLAAPAAALAAQASGMPVVVAPVSPGQALPSKPGRLRSGARKKAFTALAAVGALAVLAAVMVVFIKTPTGMLRVEIDDPTIAVRVQGTDVVLTKANQKSIRLKPGEHTLVVQYANFTFETRKFLLREGETSTVKVELFPNEMWVCHNGQIIGQTELGRAPTVTTAPATWRDDEPALEFNGYSSLVQLAGMDVDLTRSITCEAWVYPAAADKEGAVFGGDAFPLRQTPEGWSLGVMTSPRVSEAKALWETISDPPPVNVGQWQHLAAVWDAEAKEMMLFIDGKLIRRRRVPRPQSDGPSPLLLGAYPLFQGRISGARISSTARYKLDFTPPRHFQADADTMACYTFDEGSGDVLRDASGRSHDGRIIGANWTTVNAPLEEIKPPSEVDLLITVDVNSNRAPRMTWRREGTSIIGDGEEPKSEVVWRFLRFPVQIEGSYDLEIDFTQHDIFPLQIILPLGDRDLTQNVSPNGCDMGLIDGESAKLPFPMTHPEIRLNRDVLYRFVAKVRHQGDYVTVHNTLNGEDAGYYAGLRGRITVPHWVKPELKYTKIGGRIHPCPGVLTVERAVYRPVPPVPLPGTPGAPTPADVKPYAITAGVPQYHELWQFDWPKRNPHALTVFPDGKRLLIGSHSHSQQHVCDIYTGKILTSINNVNGSELGLISADGTRIYQSERRPKSGGAYLAKEFDAATGALLRDVAPLGGAMAISADGRLLAGEGDNHTVVVADVATGTVRCTLTGHEQPIFQLAFSPDGLLLLSSSKENVVRLWDLGASKELWHLDKTKIGQAAGCDPLVAWLPGGKSFLTCGGDCIVRQWNVATGEREREFKPHDRYVRSLTVSKDGSRIITSGQYDGLVKLWNLESEQEIARYIGHSKLAMCATFSPDEQYIFTCGFDDHTIRVWPVPQ